MVIFNSYVSLPEGIEWLRWNVPVGLNNQYMRYTMKSPTFEVSFAPPSPKDPNASFPIYVSENVPQVYGMWLSLHKAK